MKDHDLELTDKVKYLLAGLPGRQLLALGQNVIELVGPGIASPWVSFWQLPSLFSAFVALIIDPSVIKLGSF